MKWKVTYKLQDGPGGTMEKSYDADDLQIAPNGFAVLIKETGLVDEKGQKEAKIIGYINTAHALDLLPIEDRIAKA